MDGILINPNPKKLMNLVPGHVFRQKKFKFDPKSFASESSFLNEKVYENQLQTDSLNDFIENPKEPIIYAISSSPSDSIAKLFAAFLTEQHIEKVKGSRVVWHSINNGFSNPLLEDQEIEPTMIVLYNLSPIASNYKCDKVKDLVEKYQDIPRLIIISGMDPISFCSTKLYIPVQSIFYTKNSIVKDVEIL